MNKVIFWYNDWSFQVCKSPWIKIWCRQSRNDLKNESQRDVTLRGKVSRAFEFLRIFGAAEKIKKKVEAYCTCFWADFFGFQSVEMFCFARKTKIQILTTSSWSLTRIHQRLLKSLGLYGNGAPAMFTS